MLYKAILPAADHPAAEPLAFSDEDVLSHSVLKRYRAYHLMRAQRFSNLYNKSVDISFRTSDHRLHALKIVVWSVNEERVILEGGRTLPVRAIVGVDF